MVARRECSAAAESGKRVVEPCRGGPRGPVSPSLARRSRTALKVPASPGRWGGALTMLSRDDPGAGPLRLAWPGRVGQSSDPSRLRQAGGNGQLQVIESHRR